MYSKCLQLKTEGFGQLLNYQKSLALKFTNLRENGNYDT